jgi:hypothetical protein
MARKSIAATPIAGAAVTAMDLTNQGIGEADHLSALLAGAHAMVEGLDGPDPNNEMLYLLYLIEFAQERAEKIRSMFDDATAKLGHAAYLAREAA